MKELLQFRKILRCLLGFLPQPNTVAGVNFQIYFNNVSLLTWTNNAALYLFDNSFTTSFICLHGSAHGAQKLITETLVRSSDRISWKCVGETTSKKFELAIVKVRKWKEVGVAPSCVFVIFRIYRIRWRYSDLAEASLNRTHLEHSTLKPHRRVFTNGGGNTQPKTPLKLQSDIYFSWEYFCHWIKNTGYYVIFQQPKSCQILGAQTCPTTASPSTEWIGRMPALNWESSLLESLCGYPDTHV